MRCAVTTSHALQALAAQPGLRLPRPDHCQSRGPAPAAGSTSGSSSSSSSSSSDSSSSSSSGARSPPQGVQVQVRAPSPLAVHNRASGEASTHRACACPGAAGAVPVPARQDPDRHKDGREAAGSSPSRPRAPQGACAPAVCGLLRQAGCADRCGLQGGRCSRTIAAGR